IRRCRWTVAVRESFAAVRPNTWRSWTPTATRSRRPTRCAPVSARRYGPQARLTTHHRCTLIHQEPPNLASVAATSGAMNVDPDRRSHAHKPAPGINAEPRTRPGRCDPDRPASCGYRGESPTSAFKWCGNPLNWGPQGDEAGLKADK